LLDDIESPEKLRFSVGREFGEEEWKRAVIERTSAAFTRLQPVLLFAVVVVK
jgi:hypothetical protein